MHYLHLRVRGRVQGVGFRHFVLRQAGALGLNGSARNLRDGAVDVVAEGHRDALTQLLERVRQGPPSSQVTDVQVEWGEGPGRFQSFRIDT